MPLNNIQPLMYAQGHRQNGPGHFFWGVRFNPYFGKLRKKEMTDESYLDKFEAGVKYLGTDQDARRDVLELVRLARLGLETQTLIEQENGKANLHCLVRLGKWAQQHGISALKEFRLGHEHQPNLDHTRRMGDTYGWCDHCATRVSWCPGDAEEALAKLPKDGA